MQICPGSESILLPLTPTIAGAIVDYLRWVTWEFYINLPPDRERNTTASVSDSLANWQQKLPLRRVPTSQYQYVSPIAQRLAAKLQLTPLEICQNLPLQHILPHFHPNVAQLELRCWYNEAGYIYFQLSAEAIAIWLDYLHALPLARLSERISPLQAPQLDRDLANYAVAIYAHARCCSVLTLARAEKLVAIADNWQITTPDWLVCDLSHGKNRPTAQPMLFFDLPVEQALIHALMDVLDGICGILPENASSTALVRRFALDLARCWLEFHRHCRIFGRIQRQNPHLAIARCGLTAIVRRFLQLLLTDYLGITVPIEL